MAHSEVEMGIGALQGRLACPESGTISPMRNLIGLASGSRQHLRDSIGQPSDFERTGLNSTASIALSGMQAAQTQLRASAHNVANLATDGFRRQAVRQTPRSGGGVSTEIHRADSPGEDLVRDVVAQLAAKNAFLANLAVFKTSAKMAGVLLDERA